MYSLDNLLTYFIATGYNFYTGLVVLTLAQAGFLSGNEVVEKLSFRLAVAGLILVVFTTTASFWLVGLILLACGFPLLPGVKNDRLLPGLLVGFLSVILLFGYFGGFEHGVTLDPDQPVYILGDSLSRGGPVPSNKTFPAVLRQKYGYKIKLHARNGAKVSYFANRGDLLRGIENSPVIVELGGNDMLLSVPLAEFRNDLDKLLRRLAAGNNRLIMFELPQPLFKNNYGRVQHELARKYDVQLIPRELLARVLVLEDLTSDGIHPTPTGHRRLAALLDEFFNND